MVFLTAKGIGATGMAQRLNRLKKVHWRSFKQFFAKTEG